MPRVVPSDVVALIDRMFPWAADSTERSHQYRNMLGSAHLATVATLVDLVRQVPEELLALQGDLYTGFLAGISALSATIQAWQAGNPYQIAQISGFEGIHVVTLIRRALANCPDQIPASGTIELAFIPDKVLRESLRLDISVTNQALSTGEWKAATVVAGSVVEALLLWALRERPSSDVQNAVSTLVAKKTLSKPQSNSPEDWGLNEYIEVAAELKIIKSATATQARLAKTFRNLIHPGREVRLGQKCDRATALSALAAVEHVVRDLTP